MERKNSLGYKVICFLFFLSVFSIRTIGSSKEFVGISNLIFIFMMLLMTLYCVRSRVPILTKALIFFPFAFFTFFSSIWSIDVARTIAMSQTIFLLNLLFVIVFLFVFYFGNIDDFFDIFMWSGLAVLIYIVNHYGFYGIQNMVYYGLRMDNDVANSNGISVFFAFCLTIAYNKFKLSGKKYLLFMIGAMLFGMAIAGSKTGIISGITGVFLVELLQKTKDQNYLKYLKYIGGIITIFFIIYYLGQSSLFELVVKRFEIMFDTIMGTGTRVGFSTSERLYFVTIGLEQFLETPILGTGIATSYVLTLEKAGWAAYLHNCYVELLACGGIIGFLTYFVPVFILLINNYNYRYNSEKCKLSAILLVIYLVAEFGSVGYYIKTNYFIFALALSSWLKYEQE